MTRLFLHIVKASIVATVVLFMALPAFCKTSEKVTPSSRVDINRTPVGLGRFLTDYLPRLEEERVQTILKEALSPEKAKRSLKHLENKRVLFVSAGEAAMKAFRKNLLIRVSEQDAEIAREALMEAEAIFDPVISVSFSHSFSDSRNRSKPLHLRTRQFFPGSPLTLPEHPTKIEPQIIEIGWKYQTAGRRVLKEVFASKEPDNGPTKSSESSVGVTQRLPWGPELHLSTATIHRKVYYDKYGHSYGAPFSSTLFLELNAPLPLTKDFGPYAGPDVGLKIKEKGKERGVWAVKSTINGILLQVGNAYWTVVGDLESLYVATEKRKLVEKRVGQARKLLKERLTTAYEYHQIEAEWAGALVAEEVALQSMISNSYLLGTLLEEKPFELEGTLYLPFKYYEDLKRRDQPDRADSLSTAMNNRPELQTARLDLETARIGEKFSEKQLRPDIKILTTMTFSQDGSVYGYRKLDDSLENIMHPDSNKRTYSLSYYYPLGNRALKASAEQSEIAVTDLQLSLRAVENKIVREINDAVSHVDTSMERRVAASESVGYAELALEKLEQRREMGELEEFEWIINVRRLMTAKLSLLFTRVDHKKALLRLGAAEGTIANDFVSKLADNPFERLRMNILKSDGGFLFFAWFSK
jgi:outer membrane protein TolC